MSDAPETPDEHTAGGGAGPLEAVQRPGGAPPGGGGVPGGVTGQPVSPTGGNGFVGGPGQPGTVPVGAPGGPRRPGRRTRRWLIEWAVIVVVAVVVAFVVRTYVAQTYFIPSTSMYPTLKAGERIVVNKLAYDLHGIHRGDIVVFRTPPGEQSHCAGQPVPDLVKRVIGLPGNTISARGGQVYITGKLLQEPWLPHVSTTYTTTFGPEKVPAGEYFMMGDDRKISCDSRSWGPVKRSYIVGKVDVIVWPPSQIRFFF